MQFENLPESSRRRLVQILADRLAFYLPVDTPRGDFFLRESCRRWEGVVSSNAVVEVEPGRELWHHQVRRPNEEMPTLTAITQFNANELQFQELGPSSLAEAFHRTIERLDQPADELARLPKDLGSGDTIVRLLSIRRSFFYGLSFHVDDKLRYVLPLVFPQYFEEEKILDSRSFIAPAELANILSAAPSFFGVEG